MLITYDYQPSRADEARFHWSEISRVKKPSFYVPLNTRRSNISKIEKASSSVKTSEVWMLITYSTWVTQILFATFHGLFDAGGQIALLVSLMGTFSEQNV